MHQLKDRLAEWIKKQDPILYCLQEIHIRHKEKYTMLVRQGCILSPCLFNVYAEYIMRMYGLDEAQAGIKIVRVNNLRYADGTTLMAESKEPLDESERGE